MAIHGFHAVVPSVRRGVLVPMSIFSLFLGLAFLVSELWLASLRRSSSRQEGSRAEDGGSLSLLWRVIGCAIAAGVSLSAMGIGPRLPAGVPWGTVGTMIFGLGAALRWWAIRHLGRFFTVDVAVTEGQRVVDDGPYRLVRHPSYTGLLVEFAGFSLALGFWLGSAVVFGPILLALLHRIRVEETVLRAALGEPYAAYARRTKKLVPFVF